MQDFFPEGSPDSTAVSSWGGLGADGEDSSPSSEAPTSARSLADAMIPDHFTRRKASSTGGMSSARTISPVRRSSLSSGLEFSMSRDGLDGAALDGCCDEDFVELTNSEHGVNFSKYSTAVLGPAQAKAKFLEWKKTAWFLPIDFADNASGLQNLRLIFAPFYRYAVGTGTRYQAELLVRDSCANPTQNARAIANYTPPPAVSLGPPPPDSPLSSSEDEGASGDRWIEDVMAKTSQFNFEDIQGSVSTVTQMAKSWWEAGSGAGAKPKAGKTILPAYTRRVTVVGSHENCYPNVVVSASRMIDPLLMSRFSQTLSEDWEASRDLPSHLARGAPDLSTPAAFSAYKQTTEQFLASAACPPSDDLDDFDAPELPKSVASVDVTPLQNWGTGVWPDVKRGELDFTRELIQGYSNFRGVLQCDVQLEITALQYQVMLVPIYAATYSYNGKPWEVLIHARTGGVSAKHPWMGEQAIEDMREFMAGSLRKK